jgi:hypothetical protein
MVGIAVRRGQMPSDQAPALAAAAALTVFTVSGPGYASVARIRAMTLFVTEALAAVRQCDGLALSVSQKSLSLSNCDQGRRQITLR